MDDQTKNLILAAVLSFLVIIAWSVLFPPPEPAPTDTVTETAETGTGSTPVATTPATGQTGTSTPPPSGEAAEAVAEAPRIRIDTPSLTGSISLVGGRIDEVSLKDYHVTIDPDSPIVDILSPVGSPQAYYALYGWAPGQGLDAENVPGPLTEWTLAEGETLAPGSPVTIAWDSPSGLRYERVISVDDHYMFNITQTVANASGNAVSLAPYGIIARHGEPENLKNFFILHEGPIRMSDGTLSEQDYDDLTDFPVVASEGANAEVVQVANDGWIGFTDHYWQSILIPAPGSAFKSVLKYDPSRNIYQAETVLPTQSVADGATASVSSELFVGAKRWEVLRDYERDGVQGFVDSIDWGWFFFLTKPIFWLLHNIHQLIGNMGWSIIALTFIIKAVLFPLAFKSYVSMAKMKELQPEMEKLKEQAGDDRQKLQQGMMALYKEQKVNPAAGCLPLLLQIPIFFSLYKVIFVTIELRHAPWFGPFQDLSAPDPTSIYNLFGLLPWGVPEPGSLLALAFIGILPLLLGISMWLQQKLNPAPTDPTQQMIFAWMPWVFMFMLGGFASGLVVYWIANNTITFIQQYAIMRSQGYTPDVFGNIRSGFSKKPKPKAEKK